MGWIREAIVSWLKIVPAGQTQLQIVEPLTYEGNLMKNRIWYRGDPSELEQLFKSIGSIDRSTASRSRFWAAVPTEGLGVRKIHSGLPAMMVDKLASIVTGDMQDPEGSGVDLWMEIAEDNQFTRLLKQAVTNTLVDGDGAFKICTDGSVSEYPILDFFSGERVGYEYERGRLKEICFYTEFEKQNTAYRLKEIYGRGYVDYHLFNKQGHEVELQTLPETSGLVPVRFPGDFMMAVPLQFYASAKYARRGKSLFDGKSDMFDALDETISQWMDAVRLGRAQKYIPQDMIPRDPENGVLLKPNPFDNQFIAVGNALAEDAKSQIDVVQPSIDCDAYLATYINNLDVCLQGILSPSTLGIDVKKLDNAESQREKEKTTLYTRGELIAVLSQSLNRLADAALKTADVMRNRKPGEYDVNFSWGEYANPSFEAVVETVGKARMQGIMSLEACVEELYGDSKEQEWKDAEVERLKAEQGMKEAEEPRMTPDEFLGGAPDDDPESPTGGEADDEQAV